MLGRTHELIGVTGLIVATVYYPPENINTATIIVALIANLIGTLLPDIDQASNRLWDMLPGGNTIGKVLKNVLLGHRTLSHSLVGVGLVYYGINWLIPRLLNNDFVQVNLIIISLLIGYVTHLLADGLTEEGLPLLWPIKLKFGFPPIKKWRITTGKWFENWIIFPAVAMFLFWFVYKNWNVLWRIVG